MGIVLDPDKVKAIRNMPPPRTETKVFNMAEYKAYAMGIIMGFKPQVKRLKVFGGSALAIYQLRRKWETRDPISLSKI
ncbi:hypothetical protein CR513_44148, partial [Mucuna pruriens]